MGTVVLDEAFDDDVPGEEGGLRDPLKDREGVVEVVALRVGVEGYELRGGGGESESRCLEGEGVELPRVGRRGTGGRVGSRRDPQHLS